MMMAMLLQAAAATCPVAAPLPRALAGWANPTPLNGDALSIGTAARVTLRPVDAIRFAVPPERPPAPGSLAGQFTVQIAAAGVYRVALNAGLWVDVVREGRAVASSAHGHGPDCSGVRKMVDFTLSPGRYVLQLSGGRSAQAIAMVTRIG